VFDTVVSLGFIPDFIIPASVMYPECNPAYQAQQQAAQQQAIQAAQQAAAQAAAQAAQQQAQYQAQMLAQHSSKQLTLLNSCYLCQYQQ